jgi:hypothetical protein
MELAGPPQAASFAMTLTSFSPPSLDEDYARFVPTVTGQHSGARTTLDHRGVPA